MNLNKKGFTMVELLVTMAIMGLLIIMAFPTIRAIQSNNTNKKFEEYGKSAISAAKLYTDSYAEDMFDMRNNNQMKSIDFNDLVKKDLLKDINISDTTCLNGSSINIIKYRDDYTYCLNLICYLKNSTKEVYRKLSKEGQCKDLIIYKVTYKYSTYTDHDVSVIIGNEHSILTPESAGFNPSANLEVFKHWKSGEKTYKPGDKIEVNSNIELEAVTEPFKYTLKYNSGLDEVSGEIADQECTAKQTCELQENGYTKDYFTFTNFTYNSKDYNPGDDMKNEVQLTKNKQVFNISAVFRKNKITLNYYSNEGVLKPGTKQACPIKANCPTNQCVWINGNEEPKQCKASSGLIYTTVKYNDTDAWSSANYGLANYSTAAGGSLYMTRADCTAPSPGIWHGNSAGSSITIPENEGFATGRDFAEKFGMNETLKKSDISLDVYAEWNCPPTRCSAGSYLPANSLTCTRCEKGYYCPGGEWYRKNEIQGRKACPSDYTTESTGSSVIEHCYITVPAGKYLTPINSNTTTSCPKGRYKVAHTVNYNSSDSCDICPAGYRDGPGATSESNCKKLVPAGKYVKEKHGPAVNCPARTHSSEKYVRYG